MTEEERPKLEEWKPKHPRLEKIGEFLKTVGESSKLGKALLEGKADLFKAMAYEDPLTTGKGETLRLKPEALELTDFIPSKGVGALGAIGPVGMRMLADSKLWSSAQSLSAMLRKMDVKDWKTQKAVIEATPGFFPIPRGRDYGARPDQHVKFGYELPESKLAQDSITLDYFRPGQGAWSDSLESVFDAPRLIKGYPELKKYSVNFHPEMELNSGYLDIPNKVVGVGPHKKEKELLNTLSHEVPGHYVQYAEGWPQGSSSKYAGSQLGQIPMDQGTQNLPREMKRQHDLAKIMKENEGSMLNRSKATDAATQAYRREAGEQMATAIGGSTVAGGGKIPFGYTAPYHRMYDRRALADELEQYWKKVLAESR